MRLEGSLRCVCRGVRNVFGGKIAVCLEESLGYDRRGVWSMSGGEFVIYQEGSSGCVWREISNAFGEELAARLEGS